MNSIARRVPVTSVPLGDLCELTYGTSEPTGAKTGVRVIGMQHIRDGCLELGSLPRSALSEAETKKLALRDGDILFNRTNSIELVGKSAMFVPTDGDPVVFASYLIRLRPNTSKVHPGFLAAVLSAPSTLRRIRSMATRGVSQCNINPSRLAAHLDVPLLPLSAQRHAAGVLNLVDSMAQAVQRVSAAKGRLKRALLQQLLTGKRRFPSFADDDWRIATLAKLVRVRSGNTPSKARADFWDGSVPWVSAKDLKSTRLATSIDRITDLAVCNGAAMVAPGAVVILVRGMTLLKDVPVAHVERRLAINQDIKALEPTKDVDSEFLLNALSARRDQLLGFVNRAGHGTGKLDTDRLLSLPIRLPSIAEQRRVAGTLAALDHEITLLDRQLAALRRLKRGLMQKLLTGELEVPVSREPRPAHAARK